MRQDAFLDLPRQLQLVFQLFLLDDLRLRGFDSSFAWANWRFFSRRSRMVALLDSCKRALSTHAIA